MYYFSDQNNSENKTIDIEIMWRSPLFPVLFLATHSTKESTFEWFKSHSPLFLIIVARSPRNISNFACQAYLCVCPPRQTLPYSLILVVKFQKHVCQANVCVLAKLTNIVLGRQNLKCLSINASSFDQGFLPSQTYRDCLANISNFACQACSCVWPPRQMLLDNNFEAFSKNIFFLLFTNKKGLSSTCLYDDLTNKLQMFARQCLFVWQGLESFRPSHRHALD